jgi:homospermidine synthase
MTSSWRQWKSEDNGTVSSAEQEEKPANGDSVSSENPTQTTQIKAFLPERGCRVGLQVMHNQQISQ